MAEDFQFAQDSQTKNAAGEANPWPAKVKEARLAGGETILFVEDEGFVREVVSEILRSAGYGVITTKNAAEALCAYDRCEGRVELLLTDVVLPGETGHKLAATLREEHPDLKVLFITGYPQQMVLHGEGREAWLPKPFSTGALLRAVRQRMNGREFCQDDGSTLDRLDLDSNLHEKMAPQGGANGAHAMQRE
jgi:two-component system cell cycle sensor histidine kinase/response regulator CckA